MTTSAPGLSFNLQNLPVSQLESLRFKANQIVESIQLLQRTLEMGGQATMPAWPDILSKYNILLSQSHNLTTSLVAAHQSASQSQTQQGSPFEKITLHPRAAMSDAQLDNDLIPLLRNQQTTDVLRQENETVRHLAEHMDTKGSLGVLGHAPRTGRRPEYEDVLRECDQIRIEHDLRVERATRAVALLRDKYDWKARVAVEQEEPEELEWDPRLQGAQPVAPSEGSSESESAPTPQGGQSNDSEEEEELEEVLGNGEHTPEGTPVPSTPVPLP